MASAGVRSVIDDYLWHDSTRPSAADASCGFSTTDPRGTVATRDWRDLATSAVKFIKPSFERY